MSKKIYFRFSFMGLEDLGHKTIAALRTHDAGSASMLEDLAADVRAGLLTQKGYDNHKRAMEEKRKEILDNHQAEVKRLREEYDAAVDKYCTPDAGWLNPDDAEILRSFELSPKEFETMAVKYAANPTMCRLLEQYRVEHEGKPYGPKKAGGLLGTGDGREEWHTDWRFQTADERKAIFARVCGCVDSIIGQKDRFVKDRDRDLTARISGAYHSLQGHDPDALPAPETPRDEAPARPFIF